MSETRLQVETVVSAPFEENSYVVWLPPSRQCLLIDPGFEPQSIVEVVRQQNLTPVAILNTHGHGDHIAGNRTMKQLWPDCPLIIGANEADKLTDPVENLSAPLGVPVISPPADRLVREGDLLEIAGLRLRVQEIPGHSSGHVVFIWQAESGPWVVFGGDVLFAGSIGRTDFPDGSLEQLTNGIHNKLFVLPDETVVYSGHGPATTIGQEKRTNLYVGRPAGYRGQ